MLENEDPSLIISDESDKLFKSEVTGDEIIVENMTKYARYLIRGIIPNSIDGLKLIHRRIIDVAGVDEEVTKGNALASDVMKTYHPHGDQGIYDTICRLGQRFNNPHPFIYSEGNIGAYHNTTAAAGRYLDVSSSEFSRDVFFNRVNKKTLLNIPTEMGKGTYEPAYLIPIIPTALITGAQAISVGYRSSIPIFNLTAICNAAIDYINIRKANPFVYRNKLSSLNKYFVPDFPIANLLRNRRDLLKSYDKGIYDTSIILDGSIEITPTTIIIKTLPFGKSFEKTYHKLGQMMVNGDNFISRNFQDIKDLSSGALNGDMYFTLKRGVDPFEILDQFKKVVGFTGSWKPIMNFSDVNGTLTNLNPIQLIEIWYNERIKSVLADLKLRQNDYIREFRKCEAHIIIADHTDEVIKIIKESANREASIIPLVKRFKLSEFQAKYLSSLQLHQLTKQGKDDLLKQLNDIKQKIKDLQSSFTSVDEIVIKDIEFIKNKYLKKSDRRTTFDDFIGAVKIGDTGYIQFKSMTELSHIIYNFKNKETEVTLYPKGAYKLVAFKDNSIETDELLDMSKEFSAFDLHVLNYKPKSIVCMKDDAIFRLDEFLIKPIKDMKYASISEHFMFIDTSFKLCQGQYTDIQKRRIVSANGVSSNILCITPFVDDNMVVVHYNTKEPNTIKVERLKVGSTIKRQLMGKTKIIGIFRLNEPVVLNIPDEALSRCAIRHIYIKDWNSFFKDENYVQIFLSRKITSHDFKLTLIPKSTELYTV